MLAGVWTMPATSPITCIKEYSPPKSLLHSCAALPLHFTAPCPARLPHHASHPIQPHQQESIELLNSVPESMRACLIEAAKLAGPAFKRKAPEQAAAGGGLGGLGSGPLSFEISVDAGRAPPASAALAAFAAAAGAGPSGGQLPTAESDQLLLGAPPIPPLTSGPLLHIPPLPAPPAACAVPAGPLGDGPQQLLDLIRCAK